MRITILQGAFLPVPALRGGAIEKAWEALGQEFSLEGHEVIHISRHCDGLSKQEKIGNVQHVRIKGSNAVRSKWLLKIFEFIYVWRARKVLPNADILITHTFWAPIIYPQEKYGKIYVHVGRYPKGQLRYYRKAARFQVPTNSIYDAVLSEVPNRSNLISMIPYPLHWRIPKNPPFESRQKQILFLGRIHPEKGISELLNAWGGLSLKERDGWILRIRGPWKKEQGGAGREYLESLFKMKDTSNDSIEIMEPVFDSSEIIKELSQASVFVYPSLAERGETFGLAILEAMSLGCVPLTSSLDCFDIFNIKENGFSFDHTSGDQYSTIKNILKDVISSKAELPRLSKLAQEHAKIFELPRISKRFLKDFEGLKDA